MRKVYLRGRISSSYTSDLLTVIKPLTHLEELEFDRFLIDEYRYGLNLPLTEEEFSKIFRLVEPRSHVLTLVCNYEFNYKEHCNQEHKVKLVHKFPADLRFEM